MGEEDKNYKNYPGRRLRTTYYQQRITAARQKMCQLKQSNIRIGGAGSAQLFIVH